MPLITRVFIKSGLLFFLISLFIGILSELNGANFLALVPLFWHALMLGWITQIIMGVSMWMFPGRKKEESFSNQRLGWIAFFGVNTGLILRMISEPLVEVSGDSLWNLLLLISAVLQFIGVMSFVLELWPRIQSKKKRIRTKKQGV